MGSERGVKEVPGGETAVWPTLDGPEGRRQRREVKVPGERLQQELRLLGGDHWLGWGEAGWGAFDPGGRAHPLQAERRSCGAKAGQGGSASLTAPLFTINCDIRCAAKWGLRGWKKTDEEDTARQYWDTFQDAESPTSSTLMGHLEKEGITIRAGLRGCSEALRVRPS